MAHGSHGPCPWGCGRRDSAFGRRSLCLCRCRASSTVRACALMCFVCVCIPTSYIYCCKEHRSNERRSYGGLSRGRPDPDPDCGSMTGRSGPWRTKSERAPHGLESGAIALAFAASLAYLPSHARTRTQHSTSHTSVPGNLEVWKLGGATVRHTVPLRARRGPTRLLGSPSSRLVWGGAEKSREEGCRPHPPPAAQRSAFARSFALALVFIYFFVRASTSIGLDPYSQVILKCVCE
jgi:hypothetical protein